MRGYFFGIVLSAILLPAGLAAGEARILKVLPYLLDSQGRHALQPSLYERDAYQANLRTHPDLVRGQRYDIQWRSRTGLKRGLKLRLELRSGSGSSEGKSLVLENSVKPGWWARGWTRFTLSEAQFKELGQVTAWRVTLNTAEAEVAEEKSFLW
jgi:hypothetical protein